jgi:hypothetical protein
MSLPEEIPEVITHTGRQTGLCYQRIPVSEKAVRREDIA